MEMTQGCSPRPGGQPRPCCFPAWVGALHSHTPSPPRIQAMEESCFVHLRGGFEAVDVTLGWQGAATWPCPPSAAPLTGLLPFPPFN